MILYSVQKELRCITSAYNQWWTTKCTSLRIRKRKFWRHVGKAVAASHLHCALTQRCERLFCHVFLCVSVFSLRQNPCRTPSPIITLSLRHHRRISVVWDIISAFVLTFGLQEHRCVLMAVLGYWWENPRHFQANVSDWTPPAVDATSLLVSPDCTAIALVPPERSSLCDSYLDVLF